MTSKKDKYGDYFSIKYSKISPRDTWCFWDLKSQKDNVSEKSVAAGHLQTINDLQMEFKRRQISIYSCSAHNWRKCIGRIFRSARAETREYGERLATYKSVRNSSNYMTYTWTAPWVLLSHGQPTLLEGGRAVGFQCPQIAELNSLNKTQGC